MGGKDGIKTLYHDFFSDKSEFGYRFEIIPFDEFLNGKNVVFKTLEETDKTKNVTYSSEVSKEYSINSFFENEYIFKDLSNLKISLTYTIKEKIIKDINKQIEVLREKDTALLITEVLLHFEEQIKHCKNISTSENKILLSKVKYFEENYIELYDTLYKLYNPYLINYEKLLFENIQKINKVSNKAKWEYVFEAIIDGRITTDENMNNPKFFLDGIPKKNITVLGDKLSEVLGIDSLRPYFTDSVGHGGSKNLFTIGHKDRMKEIMEKKENKMCKYFQNKLDEL